MEVFCKSGVKGTSEKRDTCVYRAASEQGEVGRGEVKKAHPEARLEKAANVLRTQTATRDESRHPKGKYADRQGDAKGVIALRACAHRPVGGRGASLHREQETTAGPEGGGRAGGPAWSGQKCRGLRHGLPVRPCGVMCESRAEARTPGEQ